VDDSGGEGRSGVLTGFGPGLHRMRVSKTTITTMTRMVRINPMASPIWSAPEHR
jgi:hypothetical protein